MSILKIIVRYLVSPLIVLTVLGVVVVSAGYFYYLPQIPSAAELRNTQLQLPLRIYSNDDQLIAEFGQYRRRPVSYEEIPDNLKNAFIAIEDARFYQHNGIDFRGIARAVAEALKRRQVTQGASTITMQVARNFYLSNERTLDRKVREALLALKIEEELGKNEILELYLNKIFLGKRAYGVGSAAEIYYGKKVQDLTLAQSAMIAGLPKAPSRYNPITNPSRAKIRRDYILKRMLELGYISKPAFQQALAEPISASIHIVETETYAPYMAEMARSEAINRFGEENIYKLGLKIYTTLDSKAQENAIETVRDHLLRYTRRHGYLGPEDTISLSEFPSTEAQQEKLKTYKEYAGLYPALVLTSNSKEATLRVLGDSGTTRLTLKQISWARPYINENRRGKKPAKVSDVLKSGDIVRMEKDSKGKWQLTQLPKVSSALVDLDPKTGAINAVVGGFDFKYSKFNRAIQAKRQPGSSFKPFVYAAALAKGYSPATTVEDEPIELQNSTWEPQNYGLDFSGPMRLRPALAKSKNLVSIRLLQQIGLDHAIDYARQFGFTDEALPPDLTLSLGTGSATPLTMAEAYAAFANGGYKINSYFIRKIVDRNDNVIFEADPVTACEACDPMLRTSRNTKNAKVNHPAERIMAPHVHYQITSMLQSVVQSGTGARAGATLRRNDLAGKTGTTDDQKDAWFCGFTPNKVVTVWVGFDQIKPLGKRETAAGAALPIWIDYMKVALKDIKQQPWKEPRGLINVELDAETGMPPNAYTIETVVEKLVHSQIPTEQEIQAYMEANQERFAEKQRLLQLEDAAKASEIRQQERLRREALQRAVNERRRAIARQREQDRRAGRPLTPFPSEEELHRSLTLPSASRGRAEIPEQLF